MFTLRCIIFGVFQWLKFKFCLHVFQVATVWQWHTNCKETWCTFYTHENTDGGFCSVFATLEQFKYIAITINSRGLQCFMMHTWEDCARIHATALWPCTFHLYRSINIEFHTWNNGYLTQKHHIIEKQSFTFSTIQVLSVHQMVLPVVWKFQWHGHQSVGIFWEKGKCLHGAHQQHFPSLSVQHFPLSTTQMMSVCARHKGHSAD